MANLYNGLGAASAIIGMHNDAQDRKDRQRREENIASAGAIAAKGDTKRASEMLMATGDIEGAMAFEDIANSREDREFLKSERADAVAERQRERERGDAERTLLSEIMGGDQTADALQAGSAEMALLNPEMAMGIAGQAQQTRQQEQAAGASQILTSYMAADRKGRRQFIEQVQNNPEWASQIPSNVKAMLEDDDPSNDDQAVAEWVESYAPGAAAPLLQEIQQTRALQAEEASRRRIMELDAELSRKAKEAKNNGDGLSPYYAGAENLESAERRLIMGQENDMLEGAMASAEQASKYANAAMRWVNYATQNDVSTQNMGGGAWGAAQRNREGLGTSKWNDLAGIAEEMIRMTRVPGTGVFTDADARRAEKSVINAGKDWMSNLEATRFANRYAEHTQGRVDFLKWARDTYGHAGGMDSWQARAVWEEYRETFPITVDDGMTEDGLEKFKINDNYVDFKGFLSLKEQQRLAYQRAQEDEGKSADELRAERGR